MATYLRKKNYKKKIRWYLFTKCNHNCSFCFEKNIFDDSYFGSFNKKKYNKCSKKIVQFIKKTNLDKMIIMGGELTILPIKELIYSIKPLLNLKNLKICLSTNFSADNIYYLELLKKHKNKLFEIRASYYEEFFTFENFFKKMFDLNNMIKKEKITNAKVSAKFVIPIDDYEQKKTLAKKIEIAKKIAPDISFDIYLIFEKDYKDDKKIIPYFKVKNFKESDVPELIKILDLTKENDEEIKEEDKKQIYEILTKNNNYKRRCVNSTYLLMGTKYFSKNCGNLLSHDFINEKITKKFLEKSKIEEHICSNSAGCLLEFNKIITED